MLSPIGACQCLQGVVSFADSVGHLHTMIVMLNENNVSRYTPSILGPRTRGSSESAILIFRRVLACAGSGLYKVTDDFGADIYISVK